jgi:hypothetical protein
MSDIPYVNRLGDAIEAAITAPRPTRRPRLGRRRAGMLALAILLVGASGATVARIAGDPDTLAISSVECYEAPDPSVGGALYQTDGRSPADACSDLWTSRGQQAPPLVACDRDGRVVVIPGLGPGACRRAGVAALPGGYRDARARLAQLARNVAALERSADCIPPAELRRDLQGVLDRSGWSGWRAVRRPGEGGPCGHVRVRGGLPELKLSPVMNVETHEISVTSGPPRSLDDQLHGDDSLIVALFEDSGARCFTVAGLQGHARRVLAVTGRPIAFKLGRLPRNGGIEAPRGDRYAEGCAIVVGAAPIYPAPGEISIEVEIWQR